MSRVTVDDLLGAADWLEGYEPADDTDENGVKFARVAAYLRREADKRAEGTVARQVARGAGVTIARARQALRAKTTT
jgi:hypothetical protein